MISTSLIIAILSAIFCNWLAGKKGRGTILWTLLGFFFPVVSILILLILRDLDGPDIETVVVVEKTKSDD